MRFITSSYRRAALGLAAGAALLASPMAHAGDFSAEQCKLIATVSGEVVKTVGVQKLSEDFRKSIANFIMPEVNGKRTMTCEGPKNIFTPTGNDVDAFNTIREILLSPPRQISLQKAGLRSVDPKEQDNKHPDAPHVGPGQKAQPGKTTPR